MNSAVYSGLISMPLVADTLSLTPGILALRVSIPIGLVLWYPNDHPSKHSGLLNPLGYEILVLFVTFLDL